MKSAEHLAAYISAHTSGFPRRCSLRAAESFGAIAQEFDDELFGVTEHTGPLTDWARALSQPREVSRPSVAPVAMAPDIVRDTAQYDSLIAPDASGDDPEQLGFRYTDSREIPSLCFELKEDFQNL